MFSPDTAAKIPEHNARKLAQWERIKDTVHGLQLARSGEAGTEFVLTCSTHDGAFYESTVFGALPQVVLEPYGSARNPRYRDVPEARKPIDKRAIDLTDDQIDQVLALWEKKQSAFSLDFVTSVWGPDGKRHVK
jgi:hypothetical protein